MPAPKLLKAFFAAAPLLGVAACTNAGAVPNFVGGYAAGAITGPAVIGAVSGAASQLFNLGGNGYNGGYQQPQEQQSGHCVKTNDYDSYSGVQQQRIRCHSTEITPYDPQ